MAAVACTPTPDGEPTPGGSGNYVAGTSQAHLEREAEATSDPAADAEAPLPADRRSGDEPAPDGIRGQNPLPGNPRSDTATAPGSDTAAPAPIDHRSGDSSNNLPGDRPPGAAAAQVPGTTGPNPSEVAGPILLVTSSEGVAPPAEEAAEILGAYLAFWDSYWDAATHPVDPQHPGLSRHGTEPVRSRAIGVLMGRAAVGLALRLPPDHGRGRIVAVDGWDAGGRAEVIDCFVDNAVLYEVSTGLVHNDEQATVVHMALMRRERDVWRVAEVFEQATHLGRTDGCIMQTTSNTAPQPAAPPDPRGPSPPPGAVGQDTRQ